MYFRMFINIPGLYLLDVSNITPTKVMTVKNVSRYCHMFLGGGRWGSAKSSPFENHGSRETIWAEEVELFISTFCQLLKNVCYYTLKNPS